jgi:plastocyanin
LKQLTYAALVLAFTAVPAWATNQSILQKDQAFSQKAVTIQAGDTVNWGNADDVNHNITIRGGGQDVDLGLQKRGVILSHTFATSGVYSVICRVHPRMKMTVTVQ